jgi:hypothetical protein
MNRTIISFLAVGIIASSLVFSCKKGKKLTPNCNGSKPTYNSGIKTIIDNNCTGSSCHVAGSPYGNFTSYAGMAPYINSGRFKVAVLEQQTMPKNKNLSQDELNKLQCWVENNYAEN